MEAEALEGPLAGIVSRNETLEDGYIRRWDSGGLVDSIVEGTRYDSFLY